MVSLGLGIGFYFDFESAAWKFDAQSLSVMFLSKLFTLERVEW